MKLELYLLVVFQGFIGLSKQEFKSWYGPYPEENLNLQKFVNFTFDFNAFWNCQTLYETQSDNNNFHPIIFEDRYHHETLSLNCKCKFSLVPTIILLDVFLYSLEAYFQVYDLIPYGTLFFMGRPLANDGKITFGIGGYYKFELVKLYVKHRTEKSTVKGTLLESFLEMREGYMPVLNKFDYTENFYDPILTFDIFQDIEEISDSLSSFYGQRFYWLFYETFVFWIKRKFPIVDREIL